MPCLCVGICVRVCAQVVEQTSILLGLLNILGEMLGTPFAELLWCQVGRSRGPEGAEAGLRRNGVASVRLLPVGQASQPGAINGVWVCDKCGTALYLGQALSSHAFARSRRAVVTLRGCCLCLLSLAAQAVACVAFALVSEVLYASVLGLVAGGVVGFCRGYMGAVQASFALATQVRQAAASRCGVCVCVCVCVPCAWAGGRARG